MRTFSILALAAALLFAAACSSSKASPKPTATLVSDEAFKAAAQKAVESAQITEADLPAGWTASRHQVDDTKLDLSPQCTSFNDVGYPGSVASLHGDEIAQSKSVSLSSDTGVFRTTLLAAQASTRYSDLLSICRDELGKAIGAFISSTTPGRSVDVKLDPMSGDLGGWSGGYNSRVVTTVKSTGETSQFLVTGVWKQDGRILTTLTFDSTDGFDLTLSRALMSLLAKRLADADAALPQ